MISIKIKIGKQSQIGWRNQSLGMNLSISRMTGMIKAMITGWDRILRDCSVRQTHESDSPTEKSI